LLLSLGNSSFPISFEVIASKGEITVHWVARYSDVAHIFTQLRSYFPDAVFTPYGQILEQGWGSPSYGDGVVVSWSKPRVYETACHLAQFRG